MTRALPNLTVLTLTLLSLSNAATLDVRIIETTDLHSNMMDFDYYKDQPTDKFGLTRTATLINVARKEQSNTVLVDNGDLIQGSPMGDYVAADGLKSNAIHPVYKAMNHLNYTVGSLGNHEFNYGLDYLKSALGGAEFPYINANIYDAKTDQPYFKQYIIVETPVKDRDNKQHTIRIGYIGFVPPQIMQWDKNHLAGKVYTKDITETARQLVPKMREEGADIVVAIAHSGVSSDPYTAMAENSVYYLSEVAGIDAIMFGHSHAVFPSKDFATLPKANIEQGTLNGVPVVMPGQWGDHLGVIDLVLEGETGHWKVTRGHAEARPIFDAVTKKPRVGADPDLIKVLHEDHENTKRFVGQPIGKSGQDIYSYLALVQDDASTQIVSEAQKEYVLYHIQGDPDLANIPVLSAIAPFKAGGRKNDPANFVEIHQGALSFRNAADLYLYANTLSVVKVSGTEVKEWLECSAGLFNQIDVNITKPQALINWDGFRTYNFDVIDGVNYEIDVTQPARYDTDCRLKDDKSERIRHLTYKGQPLLPDQQFLIATNNYRANTGRFAGTGATRVVFNSPDAVRSIVADYIQTQTKTHGHIDPKPDQNWRLARIEGKVALDIRFETSPTQQAEAFIQGKANYPMTRLGQDEIGFAIYRINLQDAFKQ